MNLPYGRRHNVNTKEINLKVEFKILPKIQDLIKLIAVVLENCSIIHCANGYQTRARLVKTEEEKIRMIT